MSKKSDYKKSRTNLLEFLPEVFHSDANESIFETVFNRYLTKSEMLRVIGFVGKKNPTAIVDRQIKELTPHRQAFQLQPIIYNKIGTVENIISWKDIESELKQLGIDFSRTQTWLKALSFNWAPPVDYDKIINFRDYYWYNSDDYSDIPQYLTIQNRCTRAEAKLDQYERTLSEFGSIHPIVGLDSANNKFKIQSDVSLLFVKDFIFYVKNSTNTTINNQYFVTVSSSYDYNTNITTIIVDTSNPYVDNIVDGDISLEEFRFFYELEKNCKCNGAYGWDAGQWDDNQAGPVLWNSQLLQEISFPTELAWLAANPGFPSTLDIWYDTTDDQLKQYSSSPGEWLVIHDNFSKILAATTGKEYWDYSAACEFGTNKWIEENKWIHKNQVPNFSIAKQAQMPIIEFLPDLEINEFISITYQWKYRASPIFEQFSSLPTTLVEPHLFELIGIGNPDASLFATHYTINSSLNTITLNSRYGDLTHIFVPGYRFRMIDSTDLLNNKIYIVDYSLYYRTSSTQKYNTRIVVVDNFNSTINNGLMIPSYTSQGDEYIGLYQHWMFVKPYQTQPVNRKPINPMLPIPTTTTVQVQTYWEKITHFFSEEYTITTASFDNLNVISGSGTQWVISGNHASIFNDSIIDVQSIEIQGNSNPSVNGIYTFTTAVNSGINTIINVVESIPGVAGANSGTAFVHWKLSFSTSLRYFTRLDTNELRIYVNGIRQYGSYIESQVSSNPVATTTGFVASIILQEPIKQYDTIKVEVGAVTTRDIPLVSVPLRTEPNDALFTSGTLKHHSIVKYKKLEQTKRETNQYPLFDLYDVEGNTLNTTSKIFGFQESQDYPIDNFINKRVVKSSDRRVYYFEQFLTDEDNGKLFAYRDTNINYAFWYDTDHYILYRWDSISKTWDNKILTKDYFPSSSSTYYIEPVISDVAPEDPWWNIPGMIWFNTVNNTINISNGSGTINAWNVDTGLSSGVFLGLTDPALRTIWRSGPDKVLCEQMETYIPDYVDKDRNSVSINSPDGDWEIPDQLYYNVMHENRKVLSSVQLFGHFNSIINSQTFPPGFVNVGGSLFHILSDINFGVGGFIKEHNDGFDSFVSSIIVQNVNPKRLYEFAHDAYENSLNLIKDNFYKSGVSLMTNVSEEFLSNMSYNISNTLIEEYEQNDAASIVFGDSNTYNEDTKLGIRNWPATLPFVRLGKKTFPIHIFDQKNKLNVIRHHDQHYSIVSFIQSNVETLIQRILNTEDDRVTSITGKMGKVSFSKPPELFSDYVNEFGNTTGIYWRDINDKNRTLYRMTAVRIGSVTPSTYLNEGAYWYDTTANRLKELYLGNWVNAPGIPTGRLSLFSSGLNGAWEVTDIDVVLAKIFLEIETRLYHAAPSNNNALLFNFDELDFYEPLLRQEYREDSFSEYLVQYQVVNPFDNTLYDEDDAFTWNYEHSVPLGSGPKVGVSYISGGTWEDVYLKNYGTPYPHFEPWILQGYISKPSWWDTQYIPTPGRRWTTAMWYNILDGVVPAGRFLPDGVISDGLFGQVQRYNYVSVNIESFNVTDFEGNTYRPDDLLPPMTALIGGLLPPSTDIRNCSIFLHSSQVIDPASDYQYGSKGVEEFRYFTSSQRYYDELKVAFRMEPMRFVFKTLGYNYIELGCLQVEQLNQKVPAHQNSLFHGDIINENEVLKISGTLQWYTNFNRYNGYDQTSSNFTPMWKGWTTQLGYQFSSVIDEDNFLIFNRNFDIVEQDHYVTLKKSPGIANYQLDALNASVVQFPPSLERMDTESKWVFDLTSYSPVGRRIHYYGVNKFKFVVGSPNDIFVLNDEYGRSLPWENGQQVVLSSDQFLPSPLQPDVFYYVYKISPTEFQLSESLNGPVIDILSSGIGNHYVAEITSSFKALSGKTTDKIWYKYALDKDLILNFIPPSRIYGFQNIISVIFGYESYEYDVQHYRFNHESTDIDPETGRVVNWQLEIERLIDWSYRTRMNSYRKKDFYEFSADASSDTFIFDQGYPQGWKTGQEVVLITGQDGVLPEPLFENQVYYFILGETATAFKLAGTSKNARKGVGIDLLTFGSGSYFIQEVTKSKNNESFEINPFRNNIWLSHEQGIVSDVIKGPYADVRSQPLLLDQYKRPLPSNNILPLRQDKLTHIKVSDQILNDIDRDFNEENPYNYLHLSSVNLFLDGYENVILFNNYASDGSLIYDPFIGLNTTKFDMQFDRNTEFTLRPVLGGYNLVQNKDKGEFFKLIRNFEGQVEDLRYVYDTFNSIETNNFTEEGRRSLGYDGLKDYLFSININPKSQFLFWRGMIQQKGSVSSVKAFINSRRFIDAKIDEFWAVKIADFGSSEEYSLPEILLTSNDGLYDEIRFDFTTDTPPSGFEAISDLTPDRWYEFPNQRDFFNSNHNMYFNYSLEVDDTPSIVTLSGSYYYISDKVFDNVIITHETTSGTPLKDVVITLTENVNYTIINHRVVKFTSNPSTYKKLKLYFINPAKSNHNPAKIRDVIDEITISSIIIWDPIREHYYHNAIHLVDVQEDIDPALIDLGYSYSGENSFVPAEYPYGKNQVNTTWMDLSRIGYVPYVDKKVFPNMLDRLKNWGKLSEWAEYKLYQWTSSNVSPYEYDELSLLENGDITIDSKVRTTGQVRKVIFLNDPVGSPEVDTWFKYDFEVYKKVSKLFFTSASVAFVQPPIVNGNPNAVGLLEVWMEQNKIQANDAESNDNFGFSVSISDDGNTAILGAPKESPDGVSGAGSSYIFIRNENGWTQQAKLVSSDKGPNDNFGVSVSISSDGNTAVVGANLEDLEIGSPSALYEEAGTAYIFKRNGITWTQQAKIQASDCQTGDQFGNSVSISSDGNTVIVGAYEEDTGGTNTGAAYVFTRSGSVWTQQAKIQASDYQTGDQFGNSVSISSDGNTVIVGAYEEDTGGTNTGAAYVFTRSGSVWTQQAKIQASDKQAYDWFGQSVSISGDGDTVVVGAYGEDTGGNNAGSAYVFTRSGSVWTQQAKIQASDKEANDYFGQSVSISVDGNTVIVGAYQESIGGTFAGAAYIFTRNNGVWEQQQKIQASDKGPNDNFGVSVSISDDGNTALVGAYLEDTTGPNVGSAYIFSRSGGSPDIEIPHLEIPFFKAYKNGKSFVGPNADSGTGYYFGETLLDASNRFDSDLTLFNNSDYIELVKYYPSDEEVEENDEYWRFDIPYSVENVVENNQQIVKYYFWVENKTIKQKERNKNISMVEAVNQLKNNPLPYLIIEGLENKVITGSPEEEILPRRYTKAIIRGLRSFINDNERYTLRFTRDFSLRDQVSDTDYNQCVPSLYDTHQEWILFRREQLFNVDRFLWDRVTESIIGQTLDSIGTLAIRVPSLDKEFYDIEHNASTRIGLGNGQSFADGESAWNVIINYLQDGDNDFSPINIDEFVQTYDILNLIPRNINDAQEIAIVMDEIYNLFSYVNINNMFFAVLESAAFPFQVKYKDIFKTSFIALHGIKIFESGGKFDD